MTDRSAEGASRLRDGGPSDDGQMGPERLSEAPSSAAARLPSVT
jgi:hypothetical protein